MTTQEWTAADLADLGQDDPPAALAAALGAALAFVRRFVVLRDEQALAVALWIAHTYVFDRADQSPILAVTSAERRSGKSRLFDVVELLASRPWRCVRPSEAVLFRRISRDHPTVLVDEGDTLWGDRSGAFEGLRAIFNAGNRRGSPVSRVVVRGRGEMVLADFDIYSPKAIAGIGGLPATVLDRAIVIVMTRRRAGEPVETFRERTARAQAEPIRDTLAAILDDLTTLTVPDDDFPAALDDRARDGWEPLLAIADAAGGAWPALARAAATLLAADRADAADDGESLSLHLLRDLRDVFDADGADALPTIVLVERLVAIEDGPWGAIGRRETKLTADRMRRYLAKYGIRPERFRPAPGGPQVRGYLRSAMTDAWARYLLLLPQVSQPPQVSQDPPPHHARSGAAETPGPPGTPVEEYKTAEPGPSDPPSQDALNIDPAATWRAVDAQGGVLSGRRAFDRPLGPARVCPSCRGVHPAGTSCLLPAAAASPGRDPPADASEGRPAWPDAAALPDDQPF